MTLRVLVFKWLRCVNHARRVAVLNPPRPDLLVGALKRENTAFKNLLEGRNASALHESVQGAK